ncbi:hypothetical protein D3C78_1648270 [compost metagenome]
MKRNATIVILAIILAWAFYSLADQGITIAHQESSVSFLDRRSKELLLDISTIYLCKEHDALSGLPITKLKGASLHIENGIVKGVGFKGEPYPTIKCEE